MKNVKKISLLGLMIIGVVFSSLAQNKVVQKKLGDKEVKGKMKVVIVNDDNGKVTKSVETFTLDDKDDVKKILKEKGIDMNFDDENSFQFKVDGEEGESLGTKKVMVKTISHNGDEKNIQEDVKIFKYKVKSDKDYSDEDLDINIEELEGEDGMQKVIKIISKDGHFDDQEIIVKANGDVETDGHAMVFVRKKSIVKVSDLPSSINQSFDEGLSIDDLKLFPNPSNGNFKMNFTSNEERDFDLTITDAKGSEIYSKTLSAFEGTFDEDFDLSKYENGVYFFNLRSGDDHLSKKIIVQ